MNLRHAPSPPPENCFRDIYEQYADDAAFLWVMRSVAVDQPHYTKEDLARLERRIQYSLDGLMSSTDLGWSLCEAALAMEGAGEVFIAAVTAFKSHESGKIKQAVDAGLASGAAFPGLVSALGWLRPELALPWIERFLISKDLNHKHLGLAACSARRHDPGEALVKLLNRDDCLQHKKLHARALRLIGELRRLDLMPVLSRAMAADDEEVAFWANWSAILLGNRAAVTQLKPYLFKDGPFQDRAIQIAFRVLPVEQARQWIMGMAQEETLGRAVIRATAVLGDPHAVNWLILEMQKSALARAAGEAFTMITGIDLEEQRLIQVQPPEVERVPNDDPQDGNVAMDEDEKLPWPDAEKIALRWQQQGRNFIIGQRYFMGRPISSPWLLDCLEHAAQRQRHAAALELALTDPAHPLHNTRGMVVQQ